MSIALFTAVIVVNDGTASGMESVDTVHRVMRVMWPVAVWLMATEGIEGTAQGYFIVAIAILANALLYGGIGGTLWMVGSLFRPWR